MADKKPAQFIKPPSTLQEKFAGESAKLTPEAIEKAETAMEHVAEDYGETLLQEIEQLRKSVDEFRAQQDGELSEMFRQSFDLKGLGSTLGYPLLSSLGKTLCQMFEKRKKLNELDHSIVNAHITAMTAIVSNDIRGKDDKTGQAILTDLAKLVARAQQADKT
jgi:hypothetical protein